MREGPPEELIALVERLKLATPSQVCRLGRRARRLARGLPLFDSVWIDVLVQARFLTPFQAGEIASGRGDKIAIGPYILCQRLSSPGYADCYLARETDSSQFARLAVIHPPKERVGDLTTRLEALAASSGSLHSEALAPITRVGIDGDRVWAVGRHVAGRTAAEWLVRVGRLPPPLVLEIARQMVAGLVALEESGLCHTGIGARAVILTERGDVLLPLPGLRGSVCSAGGITRADPEPEAHDYVAPEQLANGSPPSTAGDVYACGCLWWHLLCGRAPIPGASAAKRLAVEAGRVPDVSRLAPDTPAPLAAAVSACVEREPDSRPESMARLAALLGPPTQAGRRALRRYLSGPSWNPIRWTAPSPRPRAAKPAPSWLPTTAGCLIAAVAITWSVWHAHTPGPATPAPTTTAGATATPMAVADGPDTARTASGANPTAPLLVDAAARSLDADRLGGEPGATEQAAYWVEKHPSQDENRVDDLVLPAGGPVAIESLELRPGQCVRGEPGCRPAVEAPYTGLVVRAEGVSFENIDFVWGDAASPDSSAGGEPAILHVVASRAEFRGCSFRAAQAAPRGPVAIRWTYPLDRTRAEMTLPSGQLQLSDCTLGHVRGGIACETLGAPAIQMANVLYSGAGPLVQLDHCPQPDEPVLVGLSNVTLRDAGPLLECQYRRIPNQPAPISIQADGCALVTRPDAPLLSFVGPVRPERILGAIRWTGQGSLVLPEAVVAAWRKPEGDVQVLDDELVSMAGLVRSKVEFAGPPERGPEANRIVRCQVPLRSASLPGIDPQAIAWPRR